MIAGKSLTIQSQAHLNFIRMVSLHEKITPIPKLGPITASAKSKPNENMHKHEYKAVTHQADHVISHAKFIHVLQQKVN